VSNVTTVFFAERFFQVPTTSPNVFQRSIHQLGLISLAVAASGKVLHRLLSTVL